MFFLDRVKNTIIKYDLIRKGDKILVGVSGGPDSIALLYILKELKSEYNLSISAVCVDHMFRGEESEKEAEFVKRLADEWEIESYIFKRNVPEIIKNTGLSPEDAGHRVRHQIYNELKEKFKFTKLALGHHAGDRAETILLHLVQGTGLKGLCSMPPKFDWTIRPLSEVTKEEILDFCQLKNLKYYLDPTNKETVYLRNKIRLNLLPYMEKELNPNIVSTLLRLEDVVSVDNDFLEKCTIESLDKVILVKDKDKFIIDLMKFNDLHLGIKRRIVRKIYRELKSESQGLSFIHVENVIKVAEKEAGAKKINLPQNIVVKKNYTSLLFINDIEPIETEKKKNQDILWNLPGKIVIPGENIILEAWYDEKLRKTKDYYQVTIDGDKVSSPLTIRKRKAGDKIRLLGMEGTKKLKKFFIDRKIELEERDKVPIICDGEEIIWIPGLALSEKAKVTNETKKYLTLKIGKEA